jgi:hypothetical protein
MIPMISSARNKERERFYLLPGMGGKAARRKQKWMLQWGIFTGLLVSAAVAAALFVVNHFWK